MSDEDEKTREAVGAVVEAGALKVDDASIFPEPGDVVMHYKGGIYIVLMLATDEATQKERVIYMEAKPPQKGARKAKVWDRTLDDWRTFAQPMVPRYRNIRKG